MLELGKIYGPVTGIYVGPSQLLVSVCGYEAVRQALNNDDLNARPDSYARRERSFGKRLGFIFKIKIVRYILGAPTNYSLLS